MTIIIRCEDCAHLNHQYLGVLDYEFRQVVYTSFTEAVTHVIETGHEMSLDVESDGGIEAVIRKSMTTPPWKLVTREQLKQGWTEMRGVTPVHHEFIVIGEQGDRIAVRNPDLILLEKEKK